MARYMPRPKRGGWPEMCPPPARAISHREKREAEHMFRSHHSTSVCILQGGCENFFRQGIQRGIRRGKSGRPDRLRLHPPPISPGCWPCRSTGHSPGRRLCRLPGRPPSRLLGRPPSRLSAASSDRLSLIGQFCQAVHQAAHRTGAAALLSWEGWKAKRFEHMFLAYHNTLVCVLQ